MIQKEFFVLMIVFSIFSCGTGNKALKTSFDEGAKFYRQKEYEKAIEKFKYVLEKKPRNSKASYNIAISYINLGDKKNAIDYLNKTLEINRWYEDARYNLAVLYYEEGEYKEAIRFSLFLGERGVPIIQKSYAKLEEQGFPYKVVPQKKSEKLLPYPANIDFSEQDITVFIEISDSGKVDAVFDCPVKTRKICDFYKPFLKNADFIAAYDFEDKRTTVSNAAVVIKLNKKLSEGVEFELREVGNVSLSGKAVVMGALKSSQIDGVIRENITSFRSCYEAELLKDSELEGRITLNFTINDRGQVVNSKINKSSINNGKVEKCMIDIIKNIQFPPIPKKGIVIVNYPFVFKTSVEVE